MLAEVATLPEVNDSSGAHNDEDSFSGSREIQVRVLRLPGGTSFGTNERSVFAKIIGEVAPDVVVIECARRMTK